MAGGRPTKYRREYCDQIIEYFSKPPEEDLFETTYFPNGTIKSQKPIKAPWEFPTFQRFAWSIGVNMAQLQRWQDKHPEFRIAYAHAKEIQEAIWLQESMAGRYNPQFSKFFGVNCLGYKDKVEQETTITNYSMRFNDADNEDDISG